jgi:site-specific recombinase XerD
MELVHPIRDTKQIDKMKQHLLKNKQYGKRNNLLFVLGINSGLRISDLLELTLGDIMTVKGEPQESIILHEVKTGKRKQFSINQSAAKAIKEYALTLPKIELDKYVFASKKDSCKPITRHQAWVILNEAAEWVGINEKIGTHSLRKTFAYHAYQSGVPLERIQIILNHKSQRDTLRYIGVTQDEINDVYDIINL